jgi:hypothetical protein
MVRQTLDWRALGAFILFPLCYGAALLGPAFYQHAAPPNGRADLYWEGVAYLLMATILATGSHAITFAFFRLRHPTWPARALALLELCTVAGSVALLYSFPWRVMPVLLGPAAVTAAIYGLGGRVSRRRTARRHFDQANVRAAHLDSWRLTKHCRLTGASSRVVG